MKKYQPSNGTECMIFQDNWCDNCQRDAAYRKNQMKPGCDILAMAFVHDVNDLEYPEEWTYNSNGHPMCTAFRPEKIKEHKPVDIVAEAKKEREKEMSDGQLMFI